MKTLHKVLLPVPFLLLLPAMAIQDPEKGASIDPQHVVRLSQLQYVDALGQTQSIPARNMLEVRAVVDAPEGMRLEVFYENGDYSLLDVRGFHLIRAGQDVQEVRFTRTKVERLGFPKIP